MWGRVLYYGRFGGYKVKDVNVVNDNVGYVLNGDFCFFSNVYIEVVFIDGFVVVYN